ncbi:hypothetical protein VV869_16400 [Photobacterium sp. MCCC 1A19761]|uniref:hypothetical protein n=1 Tax=Photobacterium sp. MCCC 1A19761 TaxID=3115000 RepID=UPI00307D7B91
MDYDADIIPLFKKYIGNTLKSLSGRSDITVNNVNNNGFNITCSDGQVLQESHRRTRIVFEKLLSEGVVHVDAALQNSGSRRNIPETLIANLPFIEHGKVNNRQHLFLKTHK